MDSFASIQQQLLNGNTSCVKRVKDFLSVIVSKQHLNAFVEVFAEEALQQAALIDEKIKNKSAGKLAGMIIGIKDNICYKNHKTEACSNMLKGFESLFTATALQRLIDEDVIIIGRLNCDEFAMGGSNEHSAYGPALNPFDTTRVSGGSSGGSAVAVAAQLCDAALGSDTGGSVRQPASFCGVYGLKPSYGRISRKGLIAFGSSFDQIGVLANHADDAELLLQLMSGHDEGDSTSSTQKYASSEKRKSHYTIAVIKQCLEADGLDPEIKVHFSAYLEKLKAAGHTVKLVDFPLLNKMVPTYYILTTAEASSNLGRYSGLLYGDRANAGESVDELVSNSRSEGFGREVKRRILLGSFV